MGDTIEKLERLDKKREHKEKEILRSSITLKVLRGNATADVSNSF